MSISSLYRRHSFPLLQRVYTALLFAAVATAAQNAAARDLFKPPSNLTQTLVLQDDGAYAAWIGIETEKDVSIADLKPEIFEVRLKDGQPSAVPSDFRAEFLIATASSSPALKISLLATAADRLPGSYAVTLHIVRKAAPGEWQSLELNLLRPAPSLAVGTAVYLEQKRTYPLIQREPERNIGDLELIEVSGKATLGGLTLQVEPNWKSFADAGTGTLTIPSRPLSIKAGQRLLVSIGSQGDFPPGIYAGKIAIRSPQLPTLTTVDFEIRSRRSTAWILIAVILGATLGWLARVRLKESQERDDAKIRASLALGKLKAAYREIEEPEIRKTLQAAINSLVYMTTYGIASDILAEAKLAEGVFDQAQADMLKRLAALEPELQELSDLTKTRWLLPAPVEEELHELLEASGRIDQAIAKKNAADATRQLRALQRESLPNIVAAVNRWRDGVARFLSAMDISHPALRQVDQTRLHELMEDVRKVVPAELVPATTDLATTIQALRSTHSLNAEIPLRIQDFCAALGEFNVWAREILALSPLSGSPLWAEVDLATGQLVDQINESGDWAVCIQRTVPLVKRQHRAWQTMLEPQVPEDKRDELNERIEAGNWELAVKSVLKPPAIAADKAQEVSLLSGAIGATYGSRIRRLSLTQLPDAPTFRVALPRESSVLTGTEAERARLRHSKWRAAAVQSLIVGAVFLAGVYALNAEVWLGSVKEIMTIFLLAFGVDLTAEGVLAVLKR